MALENLVGADKFINALVVSNPTGGDDKREGDDHIRGLKNTLKNTFPNINAVVTATPAQLNDVANKVSKAGDTMTGALTAPGLNTPRVGVQSVESDFAIITVKNGAGDRVLEALYAGAGTAGVYGVAPGGVGFNSQGVGGLSFSVADVERMRINENGWLTVGGVPDAAGHLLYQKGAWTLTLRATGDQGLFVNMSPTAANSSYLALFARGGVVTGSITQSGTTGVSYNTSSDYRLKDNVSALPASGAFIDALRPRGWTWRATGEHGAGFIAHELQAVSPSSVSGAKDATDDKGPVLQQVAYASPEIIANIVAELQSLRARVAALEALPVP